MKKSGGSPSICLLGASFNTMNMGVGALTAGAIKCIKRRHPAGRVFLLDYAKKPQMYNFRLNGREFLVEMVNMRFSRKLFLPNNIAYLLAASILLKVLPQGLRNGIISNNRCLKRLSEADMVCSVAGGDSFSDIYGLGRFFYVALPQLLAVLLGKRLVHMPQTIGPFRSRVSRLVARFIIRNSEAVYSRDYDGISEIKDTLGIRDAAGKVRFCYDVGFVLDPSRPGGQEVRRIFNGKAAGAFRVGLNVSGLLAMGGYTRDNMFGLGVDYMPLVRDVIDRLITGRGASVVLIPHVFGSADHAESDASVCAALHNELARKYRNRLSLVKGPYDQHEIKHIIGQCDFFIGSRMHACIAALSQGVPAVAIAYSRKFRGVMESLGLEGLVADPCSMDKAGVMAVIEKAIDGRHATRETLASVMPQVQERVLDLFCGAGQA